MRKPSRHHSGVLALIFVIALAGCLSMTMEMTVGSDGTIDELHVEMEMDAFLHDLMEEAAEDDGYDSLEAQFRSDIEESDWGSFDYAEEVDGDTVMITMTATEGDPASLDDITITIEDGELTFIDTDGFADEQGEADIDEFSDQIEIEYILNMPGEIIDANGEVREDGQSVSWNFQDHRDVEEFSVTAEVPEETEDNAIPGFSIPIALAVLVLLGIGAVGTRRVR